MYDLDEAMDFELLDGQNGNISYRVPFKYVQKIEPKNYKYTWVKLSGGTELVLGTMCDVTAANDGYWSSGRGEKSFTCVGVT